jgi:hypothetical protein
LPANWLTNLSSIEFPIYSANLSADVATNHKAERRSLCTAHRASIYKANGTANAAVNTANNGSLVAAVIISVCAPFRRSEHSAHRATIHPTHRATKRLSYK